MKTISIKNSLSKSAFVGVLIKVGSRYEPNNIKGISHFLEHMSFKGTKTRSKEEIVNSLEKYGAILNAWTSDEYTCYWAKIDRNYWREAKNLLLDMVNNSIYPEDELKKEKNVIIQEYKSGLDNIDSKIFELSRKSKFSQNSGLYLPIIGTLNTIKSIDKKQLIDFKNKYYNDPILILINIPNKITNNIKIWEKKFKNKFEREFFVPNNLKEKRADIGQSTVIINGLYYPYLTSKDMSYMQFYFLKILFNGFSGRLFKKIREDKGLVYSIYFGFDILSCGTIDWYVKMSLEKNKTYKAIKLIKEELIRPFSKEEIKFAKSKAKGVWTNNLDDPTSVGRHISDLIGSEINYNSLLYNYNSFIDMVAKKINHIQENINFRDFSTVQIVPK